MPGQILPLRILTNSIPSFSTMKLGPNIQPSRGGGISVFSKVFPFKLKYLGLTRNGLLNDGFGVRRYSTSGSFRGRIGSGSGRSSEFTRSRGGGGRSGDRGNFRGGSFGGRVGQAKSLIEDEEDLNEWVSGLKTDSIRLSSDSDDDGDTGRRVNRNFDSGRGGRDFDSGRGGRGRGSGPMRGERGGRGGFAASKRPRESDSDDFDISDGRGGRSGRGGGDFDMSDRRGRRGGRDFDTSDRRGGRGGRDLDTSDRRGGRGARGGSGSFSRGSRGSMSRRGSDSDDFDISDRRSSSGRGGSAPFSRGSRGSMSRRGSDSDDFNTSDRSDRRGSRGMGAPFSRGSRGSMTNSFSRRQDFDKDVDYPPRRGENGSRDAVSSLPRRGGRDSDLSFAQRRGGDTIQKGKKQALLTSDEEDDDDDDDLDSSFGQLLSDADSDEDEDEDEKLAPKRKGKNVRGDLSDGKSRADGKKKAFESSDGDDDDEGETSIRGFEDFLNDEDSEEDIEKDALKVMDASSLPGPAKRDNTHSLPKTSSGDAESYLSGTRFDECAISPLSLKGIKDAGYEKMTVVQEATLPIILKGKDVLAKARTGTGKTVAFLLPAIEVVVKSPPVDRDQKRPPINVLVICPTRELASQATAEATKLLKYHPSIGVQTVIGGVRLAMEQKRLQANPCQILVATPGRLKDHIENTAGFATRLMGVKVLVLDEADHLLDMGFRKDIEKIISAVPKQRQTLLFSATVPDDVRQICHVALKRDHEFINTVVEGSGETHAQVRQTHLVSPLDKQFSLLYALLKDHIADDIDYKVLVFCTTAMVTKLVADLLSELKLNVREIHSRKPQSYRTRVSDEFRKSKGLILVTSDVSARGVDYPDVTLVIQVGLPADREQYIHRLGRTGRKGKEGQGVLMLAPWEESFLSSVKDLPITKAPLPSVDPDTRKKVERALSNVEMKNKESAYQAWLGYYNSTRIVGKDKCRLVELANEFSRSMGLDNPPAIPKLILGKMGLKNVPGLRVK